MKDVRKDLHMRRAVLLLCLGALACGASEPTAPEHAPDLAKKPGSSGPVTVVDLGLSGSGEDSQPWAINDFGTIVGDRGAWSAPYRAFRWAPNVERGTVGTVLDLPDFGGGSGRALGINNAAQIVGYTSTAGQAERAFLYDGTLHDLGVPSGWNTSYAHAVNDAQPRLVVGAAQQSPSGRAAFVWTVAAAGAGYTISVSDPLQGLGGSRNGWSTEAATVNEAGTIVGGAFNPAGQPRPARWSAGSLAATELALAPGQVGGFVHGVNVGGTMVGYGNPASGACTVALVWPAGSTSSTAPTPLPGLGGCASMAKAVNDAGDITGSATARRGGSRAVLWTLDNGVYTVMDLGRLKGTVSSLATALNEPVAVSGGTSVEVTGWSTTGGQAFRGTLWKVFRPAP
jgi:probable HAF family extracellular repeat protein